ncbi:ras guanine nucleotide exchange factor domain-containing protein [Calycina marina]|uniref:Ras guanine nucleotide exchange factor domain-containing protein n=1 Tax=Calycina marina TaxID=1763456 RepID=A0A9P7ZAF4_9HELO|nr:ras guanine nucleotide exchange factor domain-containing protein [Calycina marina]
MDEISRIGMLQIGEVTLPKRRKSKRGPLASGREKTSRDSATSPKSPPSQPSRPNLTTRTLSAPLVPQSEPSKSAAVGQKKESNIPVQRDSVPYINDDPFFRHYQIPHSVSLARELRSAIHEKEQGDEEKSVPSPSRSGRKHASDGSVKMPPSAKNQSFEINIAVIGSAGVGKSSLIQRALGLQSLPTAIASSLRMSVDNVIYTVSMVEFDLDSLGIVPNHRIQWPKQIKWQIVPKIDGALLLYDVMNRDSITELPQTLNALVDTSLPTILVSGKCDNPENTRHIQVDSMEAACLSCVKALRTAETVPDSSRLCLSAMLRAVVANRHSRAVENFSTPRRRTISSAHLENPPGLPDARPSSQQSKHNCVSFEYSSRKALPAPPHSQLSPRSGGPPLSRNNGHTNPHHQFKLPDLPDPHEAPPLSAHPAFKSKGSTAGQGSAIKDFRRSPTPPASGFGKVVDSSFIDMEEFDADSTSYQYLDEPVLQRNDDHDFEKPAKVAGVTFKELVDRLLEQNMSRSDNNFSDIFLCLYRKFAAPSELFKAILDRLQEIAEDRNMHFLTRATDQLRIITVIAQWISTYPGDFASPTTRSNLELFISQLASDPVFNAAAQDMRLQLMSRVVEDDDTGWARSDADVEDENGTAVNSSVPLPKQLGRSNINARELEEETQKLHLDDETITGTLERKEYIVDSTSSARPHSPSQSLAPSYHTVEDYEREAATMMPKNTLPLTKFRYHVLMDTSNDDFADEMTRIDWVMFSSIRLRDLVRDVSLSSGQKEKCKSLTNVNRMTTHFNHIAKWVANMILIRDKPKHRALMLEKFMTIALKLRLLNNYNGLAAVLAGINGSAIHRLATTRSLVPADIQKRFARLVLLMGTQKSHFAYRLAWENSSVPRIPFIPLHRRDLVSAELGSKTYLGTTNELINWKKFEILSEVILPIMKSQVTPYPNPVKHDIARELILDCKMPSDEEDIYQRSLTVESTSGQADFGKKKFPWFQKEK